MFEDFFCELLETGAAREPLLCVEMSGNHMGTLEKALKFAHKAKEYGADMLKVQVYKPSTITMDCSGEDFRLKSDNDWSSYQTLYNLYENAHTPWEWIEEIFKYCREVSLPVFASPFDQSAVDFLESIDCSCYKIASPEITDHPLISACLDTKKPIVFSTGLASLEDIEEALELLPDGYLAGILKCTSAYPCPEIDVNLAAMKLLSESFQCPIGVSDHTTGAWNCYAASALGAFMVEKHFRLDEDRSSVDSSFSLPLSRIPEIKQGMQSIYNCIGKATLEIPAIAKPSLSGRRSLYAIRDIAPGERFSEENIKSIRPSYGLHPKHFNTLVNSGKAKRIIRRGERLTISDL